MPAVYTFKEGGVAMREAAQMTFRLKKGAGGWLIDAWTWTGPTPKPVVRASRKLAGDGRSRGPSTDLILNSLQLTVFSYQLSVDHPVTWN